MGQGRHTLRSVSDPVYSAPTIKFRISRTNSRQINHAIYH